MLIVHFTRETIFKPTVTLDKINYSSISAQLQLNFIKFLICDYSRLLTTYPEIISTTLFKTFDRPILNSQYSDIETSVDPLGLRVTSVDPLGLMVTSVDPLGQDVVYLSTRET
jgi:hypothetical protein